MRPPVQRGLVAADVETRRGENGGYLAHDVPDERYRGVIAGTQQIGRYARRGPHLKRVDRLTREPRIGGDGRYRVPRNVEFRHDLHMPLRGVGRQFAQLRLRIVTPVGNAVAVGFGTDGADFREAGVFADLDAPALVVGQVEVQHVEFIQGHRVDKPL